MLVEKAALKREEGTAVIIEECEVYGCPARHVCGGQRRCAVGPGPIA